MINKTFLMLMILLVPALAHAGFYSGSTLLAQTQDYTKHKAGAVTAREALNSGLFMGYVAGVFDSYAMQGNRNICPGSGISVGMAADAVMKYLDDHPEQLHYSAPSVVMLALTTAFPCERH
ncbi:Rap1a/Tai family immunity protein [Gibbsiella quercinecans]|uniref:Rap1a/Tai family immunity protein n=1 Tax=Gibbsiella quercinecans TaxID=929813 RepID=UPI00242C82D0|nr:Rap1a/Tai family immunity protein [Gibbsiella quercinecans]